jgi:serine/threonine-protein kinase
MNNNDFRRIKNLFDELADLPAGARSARLARDDIDNSTRQHLRALLDADAMLADATARPAVPAAPMETAQWIQRRIGAFVIERELGHGGMGSVFRAHRADGSVEQKVAVKLIRPEQLDEHTIARFRLERQVLALLKHPNIGTLLDVGELDDGTPYVVMEYIDGMPIVDFAQAKNLAVTQRLRLFLAVCNAVAYAHRNMVVHRDLKSSNILVTADGLPKLLDFGIAKPLLQRFGTQEIQETGAAERFFSPQNASPEQVRGELVTVGCDVYGLGVLLYELMAQSTPFDFTGKTPGQIEHLILKTEPVAPSLRNGPIPARSLRGDLDAIVLHALRKSAADRYATVDEFAADIRNYLEGRPVAARRGRTWYRVRKFVGRNRIALGVTTLFVILAVIAGAMLWLQALEVIRQRDRAVQATNFMVETFRAADPAKALGEKLTAKQILDEAQRTLTADTKVTPALRAELLGRIAEVKIHLGTAAEALPLLTHALHDVGAHDDPETRAWLFEVQANAALASGEFELAKSAIAQAEALASSVQLRAAIERDAMDLMYQQGATTELQPHIDKVLHELAPKLAVDDPLRWELLTSTAAAEEVAFSAKPAIELMEELLRNASGTPQDKPYVQKARSKLAELYRDVRRVKDAEAQMNQVRESVERLYGKDSLAYGNWANSMGATVRLDGRYTEALAFYDEAVALHGKWAGPESPQVARTKFNIAETAGDAGQWELAEKNFQECIALALKVWPDTNENVEIFRTLYGLDLNQQHRFADAEPLFHTVLTRGDRDPEFRDDETYKSAQMGLSVAQYALSPTPEHLHALERDAVLPADATDDIKEVEQHQIEVIRSLGLPLPTSLSTQEPPAKTP